MDKTKNPIWELFFSSWEIKIGVFIAFLLADKLTGGQTLCDQCYVCRVTLVQDNTHKISQKFRASGLFLCIRKYSSAYFVIRYCQFCNPIMTKPKTKLVDFGHQTRRVCKIILSEPHRNSVLTMLQFSLNNAIA